MMMRLIHGCGDCPFAYDGWCSADRLVPIRCETPPPASCPLRDAARFLGFEPEDGQVWRRGEHGRSYIVVEALRSEFSDTPPVTLWPFDPPTPRRPTYTNARRLGESYRWEATATPEQLDRARQDLQEYVRRTS